MGMKYVNFYGRRITQDTQGSNLQTNRKFVENVNGVWNQNFSVRKGLDYDKKKQSKS